MYVLIENMKVRGAQITQTPGILSPVPLFAAYMFAHALCARQDQRLHGVLPIIHRVSPDVEVCMDKGWAKVALNHRRGACGNYVEGGTPYGGDYASGSDSPSGYSMQPSATAGFTISLLLRVDDLSIRKVQDSILNMRFAGGVIDSFSRIQEYSEDASIWLPPGHAVMDARAEVEARLSEGEDIVRALFAKPTAQSSNETEDEPDQEVSSSKKTPGKRYLPVRVGYALIGDLKDREGSRLGPDHEKIPAAPVESMIGLTWLEYSLNIKNIAEALWRFEWAEDNGIEYCIVKQ